MSQQVLKRDQIITKALAETHRRDLTIERATATEDRTVDLSFASDTPLPHFSLREWDFIDIKLSMERSAMRSTRLANGAALLADHDPHDQIGVVETFSVDPTDGKARAKVRFSKSNRGEEIYRDVIDGIRRNVSVGFTIHKLELEEEREDAPDLYRADDWEPFELSIVSIPSDISVGVGRSAEFNQPKPEPELKIMSKENIQPETPVKEEANGHASPEAKAFRNDDEIVKWAEIFGKGEMARNMLLASRSVTLDDVRSKINQEIEKDRELAKKIKPIERAKGGVQTLGDAFTSSEEYHRIQHTGTSNNQVKFVVQSNLLPNQFSRATYSGSGDGLTSYDIVPGVVTIGSQAPTVADLLMQGTTDSPTIRYTKETSYTNAATMVTEGAAKPEATFVLEEVDAPVRKAAVWSKVTDETLEDFAQIRSYIDQRLSWMLRTKIDDQLLNGDGTPPNLRGIMNTSGILTEEYVAAASFAEHIFNAIQKVRTQSFFEPDGVVMHPNDYAKLRLAKDGNDQYYGGGFFQGQYGGTYTNPDFLWGLPVIQTTACSEINLTTPGAGVKGPLVGAFRLGAAVYYRNGMAVEATNHDQDDFIKNLTTIRVEQRLALAVFRPAAFCRVVNLA